MWCFCWCVSGWSHHQPSWLPLDYHLRLDAYERHHFHFFLRESLGPLLLNLSLTALQADSLTLLVVGQALEGVPWGFFIANSPAYASEIVPLALRGACTATLQMSWSIGSIIVAAATYGYNKRDDEWAWRVPLALQWLFPVRLFS
jgi:MFS family permease